MPENRSCRHSNDSELLEQVGIALYEARERVAAILTEEWGSKTATVRAAGVSTLTIEDRNKDTTMMEPVTDEDRDDDHWCEWDDYERSSRP